MKVYLAIPTYGVGVDPEIYRNHLAFVASCNGIIKNIGITTNELVHNARNHLVEEVIGDEFLNIEEDYIFWLDSDVIVGPGTLMKLISHKKDIVSGLYFQKAPPYYPVIQLKRPSEMHQKGLHNWLLAYPEGLHEVDVVGFGCVLTKVNVFLQIPKPWFEWTKDSGEDIDFCMKAKEHGFRIWYDSEILCGHQGERQVFTKDNFDEIKKNMNWRMK